MLLNCEITVRKLCGFLFEKKCYLDFHKTKSMLFIEYCSLLEDIEDVYNDTDILWIVYIG